MWVNRGTQHPWAWWHFVPSHRAIQCAVKTFFFPSLAEEDIRPCSLVVPRRLGYRRDGASDWPAQTVRQRRRPSVNVSGIDWRDSLIEVPCLEGRHIPGLSASARH